MTPQRICPNCGDRKVWVEGGDGDYYVGPAYVCTGCKNTLTIQGPYEDVIGIQTVDQIISGVTQEPKGREGG